MRIINCLFPIYNHHDNYNQHIVQCKPMYHYIVTAHVSMFLNQYFVYITLKPFILFEIISYNIPYIYTLPIHTQTIRDKIVETKVIEMWYLLKYTLLLPPPPNQCCVPTMGHFWTYQHWIGERGILFQLLLSRIVWALYKLLDYCIGDKMVETKVSIKWNVYLKWY